jgi:hypothetical protein
MTLRGAPRLNAAHWALGFDAALAETIPPN